MSLSDHPPALDAADRYLARPAGAFWRWSSAGEAIESWSSRREEASVTLALREELATILAPLRSRGLPPLGAIITVLAATREAAEFDRITDHPASLQPETRDALGLIRQLPASLRSTPPARTLILATLFEATPVACPPNTARDVIERLGRASFTVPEAKNPSDNDETTLRTALARWIEPDAAGDSATDPSDSGWKPSEAAVERLTLALRTGLDRLPEAANLVSNPHAARDLLAELRRDPKHSGFARFVDSVRGATIVPPLRVGREELPTGGVADVSHHGPIERLLLTELAHDDESLAARIALDEALYLRREAAPVRPPIDRAILIDAGLRTWGLPRVMLTAVALAWIVENDGDARVQRAGRPPTPIRLDHRADLIDHLSTLTSTLDATASLAAFSSSCGPDEEPVLLLHRRTAEAPEFRAELERCPALARGVLVATVDEGGHYGVARWSHRGRVVICDGTLDVRPLTGPRTDKLTLTQPAPRLFQERHFPLALAAPPSPSAAVDDGFLVVPGSGRMLRTDARGIGREIDRALPRGKLIWLSEERGKVRSLVRLAEQNLVVASILDRDGTITRSRFECSEEMVAADFSLGDHVGLFLADPARVRLHSLHREAPVAEFPARPLPVRTRWPQPIFFGHGERLETLGHLALGGGGRSWITAFDSPPAASIGAAFFPRGSRWPSVVTPEGELSSLDPSQPTRRSVGRVLNIARDGARLQVMREGSPTVYDLGTDRTLPAGTPIDPSPAFVGTPAAVETSWDAVIVGPDRAGDPGVWIVGPKRDPFRLDRRMDPDDLALPHPASAPRHSARDTFPLGDRTPLPASHVTATRAVLPDGSTAWLDERGVLVLTPSDSGSREVAVVLDALDADNNFVGSDLGWVAPDHVLGPTREDLEARDQAVGAFARSVLEAGEGSS